MKKLSVWFWVAIAVLAAVVITEIVLCFFYPGAAVWGAISGVLSGVATYFITKKAEQA